MSEERKLQLTLDENDAKVLIAAISTLPMIVDSDTLYTLLRAIDDPEDRLKIVMTAALMAGAEHTSKMETEMSNEKLAANMGRGAALLDRIHTWLYPEGAKGGNDN